MRCMFADNFTFFAGELPKKLGNLVKVAKLYLYNNEELWVLTYVHCIFTDIFLLFYR